ncbi:MAG TPA: subclass B3 metallo-beta-lactamase [Polyangia bacterium]|jgi:metallo-beta-lactamase class B|nr:subclass B3 metallo-beta-lactamase [Polyangia bacterium]
MRATTHTSALVAVALTAALGACRVGPHDVPHMMRGWNGSFPAFRIAGNLHYVGTDHMALFLLTTPAGHILLDSGFETNVPALRRSVESLGFRFQDIKILLASHAHIDHVQGHSLVRRLTGARVLASAADAPVIASGGRGDWAYGSAFSWEPCPVDGVVRDGEAVTLGGTTLVAHLTPGHTKGATTWTTNVVDDGRPLAVVFYASGNVPPGARLVGNPEYPQAIADFEHSFAVWRALPCDIFLGAHGEFFDLATKWRHLSAGARPNPFIDPSGYRRAIDGAEQRFRAEVAHEM